VHLYSADFVMNLNRADFGMQLLQYLDSIQVNVEY